MHGSTSARGGPRQNSPSRRPARVSAVALVADDLVHRRKRSKSAITRLPARWSSARCCCRATTLLHVTHSRPRDERLLPSYCPQWSQIVLARLMGRWWRARGTMKRRDISRLHGLKSGARPPRLRFCAIALLAAVGLSACSSSEPPSASILSSLFRRQPQVQERWVPRWAPTLLSVQVRRRL